MTSTWTDVGEFMGHQVLKWRSHGSVGDTQWTESCSPWCWRPLRTFWVAAEAQEVLVNLHLLVNQPHSCRVTDVKKLVSENKFFQLTTWEHFSLRILFIGFLVKWHGRRNVLYNVETQRGSEPLRSTESLKATSLAAEACVFYLDPLSVVTHGGVYHALLIFQWS